MKITFVLPHDSLTGGLRVVSIYAERLVRRGHQVTVIHAPPWRPALKEQVKQFIKKGQWFTPPKTSYFDNLPVERIVLDGYRPPHESEVPDADVIIATWWETAEWIEPLCTQKGAKVYFIQGHEVFDYLPIERVIATYCNSFFKITISQWLMDILQKNYGATPITLVSNGVDFKQFNSPVRLKSAIPTIGFIYASHPCKGCDIVVDAIAQARRKIPELRCVAFGSEQPLPTLPLPQNTQYFFRPPQHTLKDLYSQCDFWLFGSREEGFGLPILEAMACRTPVIASPAGAAPELLASGGGILLAQANAMLMAEAIQDACVVESDQWQRLSDLAYVTACKYDWDNAVQYFESALMLAVSGDKTIWQSEDENTQTSVFGV